MFKRQFILWVILVLFLSPQNTSAQILFSEIMYNPDGSDSGREWIEIYNSGSSDVDLSDYKLFENGVNHKFATYNSTDLILPAGKYAIIADKPDKFAVDYPVGTENLIIDSVFSINNTGEELKIIDSNGAEDDVLLYSVDWGANGTGNSLQRQNFNNSDQSESNWGPANPTPWQENSTIISDENSDSSENDGNSDSNQDSSSNSESDFDGNGSNSTHSSQIDLSDIEPLIDLEVSAGRNRYVVINTPVEFSLIHNQDKTSGIKAEWSMGDGLIKKGRKIKHYYYEPGEYNVVLNTKKGSEEAVARTKVFVSNPNLQISGKLRGKHVDILLKNDSKKEVNIGEFYIKSGNTDFKIATDTIISPGKELILNHKATKLEFSGDKTSIYYPNKEKVTDINVIGVEIDPDQDFTWLYDYVPDEKVSEFQKIINMI